MYAYLQGRFIDKTPAQIYVDVNGVGYEVNISLNTYSHIQNIEQGKLFTYLQIKEDAHVIYGFFDKTEKELFIQLIGVSGIGAATARMMLSSLKPEEISRAIVQSNVKLLESIKGIGKKTAERLVLELKDKVGKTVAENNILVTSGNTLQPDALNALVALGITRSMGEAAVQKVLSLEPHISGLEELIKKALKTL
ncbi:Holliday junction branch migration protein RuvA [Ferruginibacter albus]|uniref:Holliday junction branch migration protein RuvA n=1 Tax=Ferruginibacter albus TaxID=2875540 RepID=UPI001CC71CB2|nr:Holliday junction branch migration protein RuvA [Ferruginibacter albus]UAY52555.1 Holliday junction branch migration protein RuvA [Ferruginibacter albus]